MRFGGPAVFVRGPPPSDAAESVGGRSGYGVCVCSLWTSFVYACLHNNAMIQGNPKNIQCICFSRGTKSVRRLLRKPNRAQPE